MKRLVLALALCLCLNGCAGQTGREEAMTGFDETKPVTGVYVDTSRLTAFTPPEELYTRRDSERVEDLTAGNYGLLRPYVGSRAAFDMTVYGNSGIYNGKFGLIDENGAIVVDPVYTDVTLLRQWDDEDAPKFWRLSKEVEKENEWGTYMEQVYGFCTLDGSVAEPCIYESINYQYGYIIACNRAKDGLLRIFDSDGNLLLDTENWKQRYPIYSDMGYSSVEVSENLLFLGVTDETVEYGLDFWLCDWEGNVLSKGYDFVTLSGEAPYAYGTWEGGIGGYLDEQGEVLLGGYEYATEFHSGQAVVKQNGQQHVIDTEGNILWTAPEGYLSQNVSETTLYYNHEIDSDMESITYRWYSRDFQPMFPEADHVHWMYDDWFLVWKDGIGTLTDGSRSVELEGAVLNKADNYYGYDYGIDDLVFITTWEDSQQFWWLFSADLELLAKGVGEDSFVEIRPDYLSGNAEAVTYERMSYPAKYTVLDYAGAPKLEGVNLIAVYGGWYMVEDEFSAGYMDQDGNWLFRVNLMTDMTD